MDKKQMEMKVTHKIGILSDTHGLLRPEVEEALQGCEFILHGGDINAQEILDRLEEIAPAYAVRGNNDGEWAKYLPETLSIELCGVRFLMAHNKKMLPAKTDDTDVIIYGHSHKYEEKYSDGKLFLNPGSCGPRRFTQPVTLAVLKIKEDNSFWAERIDIALSAFKQQKEQETDEKGEPTDMNRVVRQVMRDVERGISVEKIAAKNRISTELAEQI